MFEDEVIKLFLNKDESTRYRGWVRGSTGFKRRQAARTWLAHTRGKFSLDSSIAMSSRHDVSRYIQRMPHYSYLLCINCQHCITPTKRGIDQHFTFIHRQIIGQLKQQIINYGVNLHCIEPNNMNVPLFNDPPIPGLKIHEGFQCKEIINDQGKHCNELTSTDTSMKEHCTKKHDWMKSKGIK